MNRRGIVLSTLPALAVSLVPASPVAHAATVQGAQNVPPRLPAANSAPAEIGFTTTDHGNVLDYPARAAIRRSIHADTAGTYTEYPVPTANSNPYGVASGPDGNIWFTELTGNRIARSSLQGSITEFSVPIANSGLAYIAPGADGNLWFTEFYNNKIGRMTPAGQLTEFTVPTGRPGQATSSNPLGITRGRTATSGLSSWREIRSGASPRRARSPSTPFPQAVRGSPRAVTRRVSPPGLTGTCGLWSSGQIKLGASRPPARSRSSSFPRRTAASVTLPWGQTGISGSPRRTPS